jgi:transposase InsO family protein
LPHEQQGQLLGQRGRRTVFPEREGGACWQRNYANHAEAKCDIAAYTVGFYSSRRLHSVLGNLPPSVDERTMAAKEPVVVA